MCYIICHHLTLLCNCTTISLSHIQKRMQFLQGIEKKTANKKTLLWKKGCNWDYNKRRHETYKYRKTFFILSSVRWKIRCNLRQIPIVYTSSIMTNTVGRHISMQRRLDILPTKQLDDPCSCLTNTYVSEERWFTPLFRLTAQRIHTRRWWVHLEIRRSLPVVMKYQRNDRNDKKPVYSVQNGMVNETVCAEGNL